MISMLSVIDLSVTCIARRPLWVSVYRTLATPTIGGFERLLSAKSGRLVVELTLSPLRLHPVQRCQFFTNDTGERFC